MRINKFLSKAGYCSRRQADNYIKNGRVLINGTIAALGSQVTPEDVVMVNGEIIELTENNIYLAFNKPVGVTTTTAEHDDSNIIDYIDYGERIFPIGRLDKDSHGLILLTNDGDVVNKILRSRYDHEKEYVVTVNKVLSNKFLKTLQKGVLIDEGKTKPAICDKIDDYTFKIIITQGLNRQIRKMCEALDYKVTDLKRVRILNVKLGNLSSGDYRTLSKKELKILFSKINYDKKIDFIE